MDTVVLHMPKCAGSTVRWAIVESGQYKYRWSCEHAPIGMLPDRYKDFRRIGFCRHPLSWYVSMYYHVKAQFRKQDHQEFMVTALSEDFKLTFRECLPRLLDIRNFLDTHPRHLEYIRRRIEDTVMNKYVCWLAYDFQDVQEIAPNTFTDTYYNYWYEKVGLPSATVYRIDTTDGEFSKAVAKEFPGVNIGHRNKAKEPRNIQNEFSGKQGELLAQTILEKDRKYFDKHEYGLTIR